MTERALRDWRYGPIQAERLCVGLLHISGFEEVDPQATLGGPDGKKDILARLRGQLFVAAVYFPSTEPSFHQIRNKFQRDRAGVAANNATNFVFFINQRLTPHQRDQLLAIGEPGDQIFHIERIRGLLDSPIGYGLRLEFLRLRMSDEERIAFQSTRSEPAPSAVTDQQPDEDWEDGDEVEYELTLTAFSELGTISLRVRTRWEDEFELQLAEGGIGQLELALYQLLHIDGYGAGQASDIDQNQRAAPTRLYWDSLANEALSPPEVDWWADDGETQAPAPAEDAGVASEFLATSPTLATIGISENPETFEVVASALRDAKLWRRSPQWILRSWSRSENADLVTLARAYLAAWIGDAGSGLLLYVDGGVLQHEEEIVQSRGPLHSYLLCATRSMSGEDDLASIHRLVLLCPGGVWCPRGGCVTVEKPVAEALEPLLAYAVRSAKPATVARLQEPDANEGDSLGTRVVDLCTSVLNRAGWIELDRYGWQGLDLLLARRGNCFLLLEYHPVTRQLGLRDGTGNLEIILEILASDGLPDETDEDGIIETTYERCEIWGFDYLDAANDVLAGLVKLDREPMFEPVQVTLLGLHPTGRGVLTAPGAETLCEAQLTQLLRHVDRRGGDVVPPPPHSEPIGSL